MRKVRCRSRNLNHGNQGYTPPVIAEMPVRHRFLSAVPIRQHPLLLLIKALRYLRSCRLNAVRLMDTGTLETALFRSDRLSNESRAF